MNPRKNKQLYFQQKKIQQFQQSGKKKKKKRKIVTRGHKYIVKIPNSEERTCNSNLGE